ncbi:MAG: preprotein translocase subunit SecE [Chlamydiia bacterium]
MSSESQTRKGDVLEVMVQDVSESARRFRALDAVRFFGEVKQEAQRVDWPNPPELRTSTKVVLSAMLLAGFVIYGVDLILQGAMHSLNALSLWIAS